MRTDAIIAKAQIAANAINDLLGEKEVIGFFTGEREVQIYGVQNLKDLAKECGEKAVVVPFHAPNIEFYDRQISFTHDGIKFSAIYKEESENVEADK